MAKKEPLEKFWRQRSRLLQSHLSGLFHALSKRIPGVRPFQFIAYRHEDTHGPEQRFWTSDVMLCGKRLGILYAVVIRMGHRRDWLRVRLEGFIDREEGLPQKRVELSTNLFQVDWKRGEVDQALAVLDDLKKKKAFLDAYEEGLRAVLGPKEWSPRRQSG